MVTRTTALLLGLVLLLPACAGEDPDPLVLQAPLALTASLKSVPDVGLSWTDPNGGAAGFRLEVNEGPFGTPPYVDVIVLPAGTVSYRYPARPGRTLRFRVYAVMDSIQSDPSAEVEIEVPPVPADPLHFSALALDDSTVDLRWLPPADADTVVLERSVDGGARWQGLLPPLVPVKLADPVPSPASGGTTVSGNPAGSEVRFRLSFLNAHGVGRKAEASTILSGGFGTFHRFVTAGDDGYRPGACVKDGILHAAHYDASTGSLMWSRWDAWPSTEMIDGPGGFWPGVVGWHGCAMTVDVQGRLVVAAQAYDAGGPRMYFHDGGWGAISVDVNARGAEPLLSNDSKGPWMLYRVAPGGLLRVASVEHLSVTARWDVGGYLPPGRPGFAVSPDGTLHVVTGPSGPQYLAMSPSGAWTHEVIRDVAGVGTCAAVVDPSGTIHAAWHDTGRGELWYARKVAAGWVAELVHRHTGGNLGDEVSMAWDGTVHLAYRNSVGNDLWVAKRGTAGWERRLVDHVGDVGRGVVVAAAGGMVFLAYRDATHGDLKAARLP